MKNMKITIILVAALMLALVVASAKPISTPDNEKQLNGNVSLSPSPLTIDFAIHDVGNIMTTIDNHGYIGGRQYYHEPSGEWPRNSGHDYIGEIMYWMGATLPSGDTVVDNSWDEFQSIPSLISGNDEYSIMMSTDTNTYYDYDPSDTTGTTYGNPARGWKVWNADSADYVYEKNYSPTLGGTYSGGPLAMQESHYRFDDAANGSPEMGLEITHTGLQWNYCYNEDFIFFVLEITNTSAVDYADFAFGLYIDLDVGGPDGTGENGRLGDLVGTDHPDNLAWIYDESGYDEGWKDYTGVMGTKFLETPDDIGVTGFRTGDFFLAPSTDDERYAFMTKDTFEVSLPPTDQYYVQSVSGINLTAGKTVRVVWALIAGDNEDDFRANAQRAQQFYDDYYVGAQPPITPTLTVTPGDEKVYLSWNDTSQTSIDPRTGTADFRGYKLYRSMDWGRTWGRINEKNDNPCLDVDYNALAQWGVDDPADPIPHSYIDTGLHNDREYWYCLVSYDLGDPDNGVDPLQSGFGTEQAANVVKATPRDNAAGLIISGETLEHTTLNAAEPSEGEVYPTVFDNDQIDGNSYTVTFSDELDATYWHLINETTGDTLLGYQTRTTGDPGTYDVVDGLRVVVTDADRLPLSMTQTALGGSDTTFISDFWGVTSELFGMGSFHNKPLRPTYELRVTGDSTMVSPLNYGASLNIALPFEIWDVDNNVRVTATCYDWDGDEIFQPYDLISIVDMAYNPAVDPFDVPDVWPYDFGWMFELNEAAFAPVNGDIFTIEGAPLNGPNDVFRFAPDAVDGSLASAALQDVHVVPDPYFVRYSSEVLDDNFLKFAGIPDQCTIRIYTLSGDLVQTLKHTDGTGMESWDLLSANGQQVASGTYLYHIESPYGERLGRFAVIK